MRGFGFVQFSHGHESAKAIKGVQQIDGRKVAIDWSLPREVYEAEKAKDAPAQSEEVKHISSSDRFATLITKSEKTTNRIELSEKNSTESCIKNENKTIYLEGG